VAYTVVFLWISGALASGGLEPARQAGLETESSGRPTAAQLATLADFGAVRGLSFLPLEQSAKSAGLLLYDDTRVDSVEASLEQARTALSALEEDTAMPLLRRVESELLAHPSLPQAAFLMAECLALQAQALRQRDPAMAEQLDQSRASLEGPRASAFGDPARSATPALRAVRVTGLSAQDELELDGRRVMLRSPLELAPGLHHARVWRGQSRKPAFAAFVRVHAQQTELTIPAPPLVACAADDLGSLRAADLARGAAPPSGIACQSWALVRAEGDGIGVAQCAGSRCASFVHWQRRPVQAFAPAAVDRQRLPTWVTFAVVGVAAAATTSVVLWQAGAFDSGAPNAASFRYAGVNPQGIRF
jgi:hypothetical protein